MTKRLLEKMLVVLLAGLAVATIAHAQGAADEASIDIEQMKKDRAETAMRTPLTPRIGRYLAKAAEINDQGNVEEALALLQKLDKRRLNGFETAMVYRFEGYMQYQLGEFQAAIASFGSALEQESLTYQQESTLRFQIAQLYGALLQWENVIAAVDRWLRYAELPTGIAYYLRGIASYQLGDFDAAIVDAEMAISLEPEPKESWLQLLSALYVMREDYEKATPILEQLVVHYPKKQYWVQLSLIYGSRENYRNSLAVQQVAQVQGFLDQDKELLRLARSYLYHGLPYPAAKVLTEGLGEGVIESDAEAYQLLANSWIAAREYDRSLEPLRRAAELSEDGELFVRLAQVHMQREEWGEGVKLLQRALDRGGLKSRAAVQLLLGICLYNDARPDAARSSFVQARKDAKIRDQADTWIAHIEKERQAG